MRSRRQMLHNCATRHHSRGVSGTFDHFEDETGEPRIDRPTAQPPRKMMEWYSVDALSSRHEIGYGHFGVLRRRRAVGRCVRCARDRVIISQFSLRFINDRNALRCSFHSHLFLSAKKPCFHSMFSTYNFLRGKGALWSCKRRIASLFPHF